MFCSFAVKRICVTASCFVPIALDQAIRKVGFSLLKQPNCLPHNIGLRHNNCLYPKELFQYLTDFAFR